ncbi:MAG: chloride channel protein, partial [Actinomycetota bacterium]|nr:chloride channel protein [Actinomycetota bacterium]
MSSSDPTPRSGRDGNVPAGDGHAPAATTANRASAPPKKPVVSDGRGISARLRDRLESVRERLARAVARGPAGMLALSLLVGAITFRYMILGFTYAFTGHRDYSLAGHASNPLLPGLGIWFVVLVPVVGGLIYGPLVSRFAPEARGHGVPEVMLAVNRLGGRMRPQVPIVKSLASALCIGSGGSVGREGPIVQIGSALGSMLGQLVRVTESQLR